jgi:hypothetical protein
VYEEGSEVMNVASERQIRAKECRKVSHAVAGEWMQLMRWKKVSGVSMLQLTA